MFLLVLAVIVALSISGLCSLLEAAVLSLTPAQVADLSRKTPSLGLMWQRFKERIDQPIAVILIVNTAAHTIGATIAGAQFEIIYGEEGLIWFSLLFTYLMLQFTEVLPKTLGVSYNRALAPVIAYPLWVLVRVLAPVLSVVHLINRPFERKQEKGQRATLEEIAALAGLARLANIIGPHQERIIRGASRLSALDARAVMIPLEQVVMLSTSQTLAQAVDAAYLDLHTRFPIAEEGNKNSILGYINFKELIFRSRTQPADQRLDPIIRPVHFVRPDETASMLLKVFVDHRQHMAIVRDDNDRTLGLVTLEDIVEELVGELEDEFDRLPRLCHQMSGGTWLVGGGVPISRLAAMLDIQLPDCEGTTSAWLIRQFGRLPRHQEVLREAGHAFSVRRTRRGKIFEVAVTSDQLPAPGQPTGETPRNQN